MQTRNYKNYFLRLNRPKLSDIDFAAISRRKERAILKQQLWLSPAETAPIIGAKDDQAVTRAIRLGQFPFEHTRMGRKILISARSLGLISEEKARNEEAQNQAESLATQA